MRPYFVLAWGIVLAGARINGGRAGARAGVPALVRSGGVRVDLQGYGVQMQEVQLHVALRLLRGAKGDRRQPRLPRRGAADAARCGPSLLVRGIARFPRKFVHYVFEYAKPLPGRLGHRHGGSARRPAGVGAWIARLLGQRNTCLPRGAPGRAHGTHAPTDLVSSGLSLTPLPALTSMTLR